MASVVFPKPSRFDIFKMMYINEQKRRHHDNSYWQTFDQVYENLGGMDAIYNVFCAFNNVPGEVQKRIIGFTNADITSFLEYEDAGKIYAEEISR